MVGAFGEEDHRHQRDGRSLEFFAHAERDSSKIGCRECGEVMRGELAGPRIEDLKELVQSQMRSFLNSKLT